MLARVLTRIASGKPLLVVFENLHAGESSLEALQYVFQRLETAPVLIVGTYRQTEIQKGHPLVKLIDGLAEEPRFASLMLGPLTASQHEEFVASVLGSSEVAPSLLHRSYQATEGNPFFTRELVRALLESGGIVRDDSGQWTLSGEMAISSDALPATIQATVEKRVERLPEDVRESLSIASVLGKTFEFEELEALVEDDKGLEKAVDRLIAEGLLEEDRESRGDRLSFTSAIVRDVLYASLSRRRRRSLHRRCAEHLERRHSKRLEGIYAQLVHHYSEGDEPEKTVEYGLKQARHALDSFSPEEAQQVLKIVIDFAADTDWTGDRTAEAEARMLLAAAHRLQGSLDASLREAAAAQRLFDSEALPHRALDAIAFATDAAWQARRIDEARRWLDLGIERARATGRTDVLRTFLSLGATAANLRSDYETARVYLDEIESLAPHSALLDGNEIPSGGTLRCSIANLSEIDEPGTVNTEEGSEITSLIFETLITADMNGRLTRGLASAWELLDDGRALRLTLQRSARFSDGSSVTAADVKSSFERAARARPDKIPASLEPVKGLNAYRSGEAGELSGIRVLSETELLIELDQQLGIYPAMLTDPNVAVAKRDAVVIGSGPFRVETRSPSGIVLARNENHWRTPSRIDHIEFSVIEDARAAAEAFRAGEIDLARDLLQRDFDELLRDPRLKPLYVEAPRKNAYFMLFNQSRPLAGDVALRKALSGSLRVHELVWRAVGRLAQPAPSLIPPGIVGHDAGRRREVVRGEDVAAMLANVRTRHHVEQLRLNVSVHPMFLDRYAPILHAITAAWNDLGVTLDVRTRTMQDYLSTFQDAQEVDILLGRWMADYDDADNFTYGLFHSESGVFRHYLSARELDLLVEQARRETAVERRESLYRSFESTILSQAAIVPLFYEINYRLAQGSVRGISLTSSRPYVNYAELGIASAARGAATMPVAVGLGGTEIHVPITEETRSIDPADSVTFVDHELRANVFECVARCREGARVVPWLAASIDAEQGGRRYRLRLRDDVRFHDGRRLTARDVRYSWERRLQRSELIQSLRCIRGVSEVIRGEATEIEGLRILSSHEITLDLVEPMAFLPALLSEGGVGIVPEGTGAIGSSWRDGCVGTGPFRVLEFQPGSYLELERNPDYWRPGVPKLDRLIFHLGQTPDQIREEFLRGRLSLASDISPADVDRFLHDRELASRHKSVARLCIYFAAFNRHSPHLRSLPVRRALIRGLHSDAIVRQTLGRVATPATGIIPPGLLGHSGTRSASYETPGDEAALRGLTLRAAVQPLFLTQYAAFTEALIAQWNLRGVSLTFVNKTGQEYLDAVRAGSPDLVIGRWMGAVPDADYFTYDLFHTENSFLGHLVGLPAIDELIERGRSEPDPNARNSIYRHIEEAVAREAVLLPLFHEQAYRFIRPEFDGLALNLAHPEVSYELLTMRK